MNKTSSVFPLNLRAVQYAQNELGQPFGKDDWTSRIQVVVVREEYVGAIQGPCLHTLEE